MAVITRANDASVFMKHLLKEMELPMQCSHVQFVETFAKLQEDARKYEKELYSIHTEALAKTAELRGDQINQDMIEKIENVV